MQIDWFTWIAQIINFLILVALLRYFLYGRIVKAIDERQKKIASKWERAGEETEKAEEQAESYNQKSQQLEKERAEILSRARKEAEEEKKRFIKQAREEVEEVREKWQEAVEQEKEAFFQELREGLCKQVTAISRRFISDMADEKLEEHIVQNFINNTEKSEDKRNQLEDFIKQSDKEVQVVSSFEINRENKEKLTQMLQDFHKDRVRIKFEQSSDFICGLSLVSNGRKIDWSVDSYLNDLGEEFSHFFDQHSQNTKQEKQE
jgi:F-type H+-transporting ATPase subunit b